MAFYYLNNNLQPSGEHEVHVEGCSWLALAHSTTFLGNFLSCQSAIAAARNYRWNVDGCYYCCENCHTR